MAHEDAWSYGVSAPKEALARFGRPGISDADHGSQFMSTAHAGTRVATGVRFGAPW